MKALLYFVPLLRRTRGLLAVTLMLSLVTIGAGIGLLGLSGWFLTAAALSTAGAAFNLFAPSAGVRGLSFIRILSRYGERVTGHDATLRLLSALRRSTFAGLLHLVPFGRRFGRADLVSRLVADLDALDTLFLVGLGPITTALLTGTGMSLALVFLLPAAVPVFMAGFLLAALAVPATLIAATRRPAREAAAAAAALRARVLDGIEGFQDLLVFGALIEMEAAIEAESARLAHARRVLGRAGALAAGAVQVISGVILIAVLLAGLEAYDAGRLEAPLLVGLLLAVVASFEACAVLVRSATRLAGAAAAAERLVPIVTAKAGSAEPAAKGALPPGGDIVFDNLRFGNGGRANVFEQLSFRVEAGECVAIRGASGSGKSTIAQLLVRLAEPQSGSIRVAGTDIGGVSLRDLRERVALMIQAGSVFNDSVSANLRLGRPGATDQELWSMLEAVRLGDAVRALPGGLGAMLGEGGRTLSSGEARRISLARTLLSPARVLVLDEPTGGLDPETEAAFLADLPALAQGRTMVLITHADLPAGFGRSLWLRGGRIAE